MALLVVSSLSGGGCGAGEAPSASSERPLESVVTDLGSADYETHSAAVRELPKYGEAAVPHLIALLRASPLDDGEMEDILRGIGSLGHRADAAIPDLVVALRGPLRFARYEAEATISKFGEPAARALVAELDADTDRAVTAANVLGRFEDLPDVVVPALTRALSHDDKYVRYCATHGLQRFRALSAPAIPRLVELLDDETSQWAASDCLAMIGTVAVPALTAALASESLWPRVFAARALKAIGRSASASIPALLRLQTDALSGVRGAATEALGAVLPASEAVPLLVRALGEPDEGMRGIAADALGRLGDEAKAAAQPLRSAMSVGGWYGRLRAAHALLLVVTDADAEAIAVLCGALGSRDWMDHSEVADRLGQLGPRAASALPALREYAARGGEGCSLVKVEAAIASIEKAAAGQ